MNNNNTKHRRLSSVDEVKVIQAIEVKSIVGLGTEENPITAITEYFTLDGTRLARIGMNDTPEEIHEWTPLPTPTSKE